MGSLFFASFDKKHKKGCKPYFRGYNGSGKMLKGEMKMRRTATLDLTKGSVTKQLIVFILPVLLTYLLQHLYTVADRVVVGQFAENGKVALAAVGSTAASTALFLNVFTGLAVGTNVICANRRGAKDQKGLELCMHSSMLLSVWVGIAIGVLGFASCEPLLTLLGTPEDVLEPATLYMCIYFVGVPAASIYNFGASILRACGDTKNPMYILSLTGLVNVGLNLVLVIGFHMGVAGVAIATVVAQYISAVWVMGILFSKTGEYKMQWKRMRFHKASMKSVIRVGVPSGLNGMVFTISNLLLQTALNPFGSVAIAGKTAALDISTLVYQGIAASYTACVSFSGQCYGARQYKRIDTLLLKCIGLCELFVITVAGVFTVFPEFFLGLFNSDPEVIQVGISLLLLNCWGYVPYTTSEIALGCVRGMGHSAVPSLLNFVGICVPRIIWILLIFPLNKTVTFLYWCYPISWTISAILQGTYYIWCRRKLTASAGNE